MTKRTNLDAEWLFRADPKDIGLAEKWFTQPADDDWHAAKVPAWWDDYDEPRSDGPGWYRREFELPADLDAKAAGLCIAGIDEEAGVWLNCTPVTPLPEHRERLLYDISHAVHPGMNSLVVRVPDYAGPTGLLRGVAIGSLAHGPAALLTGDHADKAARQSEHWVREAVIYEVFLRSFSPAGNFDGLRLRLDELRDLGVTILWLMPINPVGVEGRKGTLGSPYAVRDYCGINPEFGTLEDFKALLDAAHARGMKLIIDWVANHTAWDHPWTREHPDWYTRDEGGNIKPAHPEWTDVADLDYSSAGLRAAMEAALLYWLRDVGIDGFRCDVAGMVPRDFWESVRRRLDAVKPLIMLAEDQDPAQHLVSFDLTYDWGTYALLGSLPAGKLKPVHIQRRLAEETLDYPRGSLRMRFSSNHDKNAWTGPARVRFGAAAPAAAVLAFTLPGVPLIYNGQEVGNDKKLDLFEKLPIDWTREDLGLRQLYTDLTRLRRAYPALRHGETTYLHTPTDDVFAMRRQSADDTILVLINFTPTTREFTFDGEPRKLLGDANTESHRVHLPPFGYFIAQIT
ncbi:MAG: DUF3459 domain-containing protein [Phycisphaerae bacterium]|nr:DUF3459 domain-containing protein [Phycisphaerae bacterium]